MKCTRTTHSRLLFLAGVSILVLLVFFLGASAVPLTWDGSAPTKVRQKTLPRWYTETQFLLDGLSFVGNSQWLSVDPTANHMFSDSRILRHLIRPTDVLRPVGEYIDWNSDLMMAAFEVVRKGEFHGLFRGDEPYHIKRPGSLLTADEQNVNSRYLPSMFLSGMQRVVTNTRDGRAVEYLINMIKPFVEDEASRDLAWIFELLCVDISQFGFICRILLHRRMDEVAIRVLHEGSHCTINDLSVWRWCVNTLRMSIFNMNEDAFFNMTPLQVSLFSLFCSLGVSTFLVRLSTSSSNIELSLQKLRRCTNTRIRSSMDRRCLEKIFERLGTSCF